MAFLHNRVSQKELKRLLYEEKEPRITLSFYRYTPLVDPQVFRDTLFATFQQLGVFGRIYVAAEGINAQLSVPRSNFNAFRDHLYSLPGLDGVRLNIAVEDDGKSFWVLKIKVRDKVVADGIDDPNFNMENRGKYVDAATFNVLAEDPDTIVVDMRNHYEYEVGHFENAIEIPSDTFRDQLPMAAALLKDAKDKNIIMYCTGGIRCEKASAFMLHKGFANVYHLEGGIINYANQVAGDPNLKNKFRGKNFVFDNRLGERITGEIISHCHQCSTLADTHVNCANAACHLLFIQCSQCATEFEGCCSAACRDFIHLPEEEQVVLRKGVEKDRNIFNKSKRLRPRLKED
jgi:UPF0176 protein